MIFLYNGLLNLLSSARLGLRWADGGPDVVRLSSLALIPSSTSTTSLGQLGRRLIGRGTPLPASPYSFVGEHHVPRTIGAGGGSDVVRLSLLALIPSSTSTTSLEQLGPTASRTWCLPPRNPLFLRRRAPRPPDNWDPRRVGRGAPLPASPYFFVDEHHVPRAQGTRGGSDVVRLSPLALVPSSAGTTPLEQLGPTAGRTWCASPR